MRRHKKNQALLCAALLTFGMFCTGCQQKPAQVTTEQPIAMLPGGEELPEPPQTEEPVTEEERDMERPKMTAMKLTKDVSPENVKQEILENRQFLDGSLRFTFDLLRSCMQDEMLKTENMMVSPTSLMLALSIAANGAKGDTLQKIERTLTASDSLPNGLSIEKLNMYLSALTAKLEADSGVSFQSANALWMRDDEERIQMKPAYLDKISQLGSEVYSAPFDTTTLKDINAWVNYNTKGMIPELLDTISDEQLIFIVNALAFEGEWNSPFEKSMTYERAFTDGAGEEQMVDFMSSDERIYMENDNVTGFLKPYMGGHFAFAALLPKSGTPVEYINQLNAAEWEQLMKNAEYDNVSVAMPKFKSEYTIELNDMLAAMGMPTAFIEDADFSDMADTKTNQLWINSVLQKTFIEVDEEGTKAAAATGIDVGCNALAIGGKEVVLNRPFVYAIVDTDTNLPIFIGVLNHVEN